MTDEPNKEQTGASVAEGLAIHAIAAGLITIFFRWQKSKNSYWEAGDESLLANGLGACFDVLYWLLKPRIMRWRNG